MPSHPPGSTECDDTASDTWEGSTTKRKRHNGRNEWTTREEGGTCWPPVMYIM